MIYTMFGSEVQILYGDIKTGEIQVLRKSDAVIFNLCISELKSDGGLDEIERAIKQAATKKTD